MSDLIHQLSKCKPTRFVATSDGDRILRIDENNREWLNDEDDELVRACDYDALYKVAQGLRNDLLRCRGLLNLYEGDEVVHEEDARLYVAPDVPTQDKDAEEDSRAAGKGKKR